MLFCHFIYQHPSGMRIGRFLQGKTTVSLYFLFKKVSAACRLSCRFLLAISGILATLSAPFGCSFADEKQINLWNRF